ncbi:hypothetical protein [Priestia megaterium]|nr:hypothetical protein [Priestia megaterium]MDC7783254.1 hypothetical protein [Priestia megaterium]
MNIIENKKQPLMKQSAQEEVRTLLTTAIHKLSGQKTQFNQ